jgi:hypothetical protein
MFEKRVLRIIFGLKKDEVTGDRGNSIMRNILTYNLLKYN